MNELQTAAHPDPLSSSCTSVALSADGRRCVQVVGGIGQLEGCVLAAGVIAAAFVDGAVWLVVRGERGDALLRFDATGAAVGEPVALGDLGDAPVITAARTGARVALIEGARAVVVRERGGEIAVDELGARTRDRHVHLIGRGILGRRGNALAIAGGTSAGLVLPSDLRASNVVAGALVFDGASVVLELDTRGMRHLIMYDARRAELLSRMRIGEVAVAAIAERRGAVVIGRDRHLAVLDLRTGRCTHERIFPAPVAGVAISADGERVMVIDVRGATLELTGALRDVTTSVEVVEVSAIAVDDHDDGRAVGDGAHVHGGDVGGEHVHGGEGEGARERGAGEGARESDNDNEGESENEKEGAREGESEGARESEGDSDRDREDEGESDGEAADGDDDTALLALRPRSGVADRGVADAIAAAVFEDTFQLVSAWCHTAATLAAAARPGHEGPSAAQLDAARAQEAAAHARFAGWDGAPTPMAALAADYDLSPVACVILTLAAAPQLWGELARAYGAISADPTRPLVDEMLVCQLLELARGARVEVTRELDDGAPLIRHGLIAIGRGARPFAALEVPHVVIRRLAGDRFEAGAFGAVVRRVADRTLDQLRVPRARIDAVVAELAHAPATGEARIVIRGRTGSGRRTLAAALAKRAGRELGLIEVAGTGADAIATLRADLRDTHLRGWLACVSGLDGFVAADEAQRAALRGVLDAHPGPLFVCGGVTGTAPLAAGHTLVELPVLAVGERTAVWRDTLRAHALCPAEAASLAERYSVGPGTIARVVAAAATAADPGSVGTRIDRILRQRRAAQLGPLATRVEHLGSWADLVLPDELLASVRELVARVQLRATVLDAWGLERVASTGRAVTALLQGGPGTGKTMVAGVVARALGYDLYRVDLSRVTSKWIGETEKNLGALFDAAEDGQCILLFDEADSLFGKRTEVKSSNDHHANAQVNYLLQRIDAFEGVAILTTNFGTAIDPAFKRRLSLHLQFPFPDDSERERLWRAHLPSTVPTAGDLELPALARKYELSGGYIRNAVLRAAYLAAAERTPITADYLRRAVQAEYRDRGKIAVSGTLE